MVNTKNGLSIASSIIDVGLFTLRAAVGPPPHVSGGTAGDSRC